MTSTSSTTALYYSTSVINKPADLPGERNGSDGVRRQVERAMKSTKSSLQTALSRLPAYAVRLLVIHSTWIVISCFPPTSVPDRRRRTQQENHSRRTEPNDAASLSFPMEAKRFHGDHRRDRVTIEFFHQPANDPQASSSEHDGLGLLL